MSSYQAPLTLLRFKCRPIYINRELLTRYHLHILILWYDIGVMDIVCMNNSDIDHRYHLP